MMRSFLLFVLLCLVTGLYSQEARLAQQYFQDGEYEKAAQLYDLLYQRDAQNEFYFDRYIDCLFAMEDYETCEKVIKRELKKTPQNSKLYVTYGRLYEQRYQDGEAMVQYQKAIEILPRDRYAVIKLANAFVMLTKYDLAIETFEKGGRLLKDDMVFAYNLGDLYRRKGDVPKMIESYLNSLEANPGRVNSLQTSFQRFLSEDDFLELQKQLYARIQDNDDKIYFVEMLTWVFVQRKDYAGAYRQVRALDRRLKENGARIYALAEIAANDKDYDTAIAAYDYIVEEKGPLSSFYIDAKREALRNRRNKLVEGFAYSQEELKDLEKQYEAFLNEFGRSKITAGIVLELANLEAFYLNNLDRAIEWLTEMIAYPNVDKNIQAEGKLSLADFYLMKGEIWEATLLYSQVDKDFKEDLLGHEARYRNAKLSYYAGDFQWAQAQFEVLKASTSKLIANDALDLSVFIMDNLGLDTTVAALRLYSDADLLVFQNRFEEAFLKMDTLLTAFPEHSLEDDVLYLKAKVYLKKRDYEKAAQMFQQIVDQHPEEIRADNALFELASLYETLLDDIEKAKSLYETIFIDYSSSTFAVEARKRFRILRGDKVQ